MLCLIESLGSRVFFIRTKYYNEMVLDLSHIENLAITGANGFVGRSIVENIATFPAEYLPMKLTLITRSGVNYSIEQRLSERTKFYSQDLCLPWNLPEEFSHLINLAADGTRDPYSDNACSQFEMISENLVRWIERSNTRVKVFHASSGACFGYKPIDARGNQINSKKLFIQNRIKVEESLAKYAKRLDFSLTIGRLFTFSGKNILKNSKYAISDFTLSAVKNGLISVNGDPQTQRSYLHQDSMSEWILRAITTAVPDSFFQIGSNEVVTILQLAEYISHKTGAEVEFSKEPSSGDIYIPDNSDTKTKLGVEEGKNWKEAVLEMIAEARKINNVG
jgi:nucleoside-diphosphate-sugar epimerase